ncbi:MAG: TonB-dependent receptor [Candidatus Omnitrophota bacterium]|nr:MAG: TonB-dependent receptor [Candidatus Omnitrophota bacterium]
MKRKITILIGMLVLLKANCIWAEEKTSSSAEYNLGEVLVSATKVKSHQAEVGSSSSVITAQDLEKSGKKSVGEVLRNVPGVSVMQSGAFGGTSSIYVRGSKPGHTLVMIDGVEVNDPISARGYFDFAHLTTNNIERIEIVRGAQSTLYGSKAIGGVVNIITKKGKGRPGWQFAFEGGSYNTFQETLSLSGSQNKLDYSLSVLRLDSEGISKTCDTSEDDEYENITFSNRLGYEVSESSKLDFVFRLTDAKYDYDGGAYQDDSDKVAWWRNIIGKAAFSQVLTSIWDHELSFSYAQTRRKYRDDPDFDDAPGTGRTHNWYKSRIGKTEWQHNISALDWYTLTCGLEYEEERGFADGRVSSNRLDRRAVDSKGCYLQNQFKWRESLFIIPGLRIDDHELFGTETTYKVSTSYIIPRIKTRLKGNWATGFKAPSLYQLFHPRYGNEALRPDESRSYDFGFEQGLLDDKLTFGLTYFHNDFKNMVEWDTNALIYNNIDNAQTKGFELEGSFRPIEDLTLGANYTYTKTKDKDTGRKLTERPENQVGLDLNWAFLEKGNVNLMAAYVGHRWDNSANTRKVKPYTKVDLSASYDLTETFQIFGRIDNLFDRNYQQIRGYATPGRSFYAGSKASF